VAGGAGSDSDSDYDGLRASWSAPDETERIAARENRLNPVAMTVAAAVVVAVALPLVVVECSGENGEKRARRDAAQGTAALGERHAGIPSCFG
jgi:hypothetical protein